MDGLPEGVEPSHLEGVDPSSTPMSDYNNNPGNIRHSGIDYEGALGYDPKTKFVFFKTPEHGRKALVGDLAAKQRRGIDTPHKLVEAYLGKDTPENVNSPETKANYKQHIADSLGMKDVHETFPELSSIPLANAVSQFESGRWNKPKADENSGKAFDGSELTPSTEESRPGETLEYTDPKKIPGVKEAQSNALKTVGAVTGAGVTGGIETGRKILPLVPNIYSQVMGLDQNINRPSTRMGMQRYLNSQINGNLNMHLSDLEKEYNKLLQSKNPGAAPVKIRTMPEVQQALDAIKPVPDTFVQKPRIAQVPGRPGVFHNTGQFTSHKIPGHPGIDTTKYEINPKTPLRNIAKSGAKTAGNVVRGALPSVARVGLGGLGGLGALSGGYDTWEHAKEHGWTDPRTLTKGAATIGSGLMMIPTPITQAAGIALNAPELAWSGYDYLKKPAPTHGVSGNIKNN